MRILSFEMRVYFDDLLEEVGPDEAILSNTLIYRELGLLELSRKRFISAVRVLTDFVICCGL